MRKEIEEIVESLLKNEEDVTSTKKPQSKQVKHDDVNFGLELAYL